MSYTDANQLKDPSGIPLGSRVEIFPTMPLPDLNCPGGIAYGARFKADASSSLYAIICSPAMPPRIDAVQAMRTIDSPNILRLMEAGVVAWPDGTHVYALVYQRPSTPRMITNIDEARPLLSEDTINHNFITPMIAALGSLQNAGMVHNAIRPTNIFWRIGTSTPPQLGECLAAPAGFGQPVVFEPVERAQATPMGRGVGIHADDCYAFGVTLALLVMGRNPFQGMEDQAIIDLKMQRGTFSAMVGTQRLSPSHIEILRGLLADDSKQRWSASDLEMWLSGRRMTPKSSDAGRRASRHFDFAGKEYWQANTLAIALYNNVSEATKVIENESLTKWLRRAMNDEDRARDLDSVVSELKQSGRTAHYDDQVVARVCIVLDHAAPVRYRGLSVMPSGVAPLLAEAAISGNNIAILSEIISSQLVVLWIEMQKEHKGDHLSTTQLFDKLKNLIEKTSFGNGLERVVYEANPGLPCLSPMLRTQYVTGPKQLLPALERVAAGGNRPREPVDRHIASFLIVRDRRGEGVFTQMSAPEGSTKRNSALLSLFSDLQNRHGPERLPHLAGWLAPAADPLIRRFLSKTLREHTQKQIKDVVSKGDIIGLARLVEDPRRVERDRQDFLAARLLHMNIQKEIIGLEAKLNNRESVVRAAGKPMAASISSFLAIILICAAVLRALFEAWFQ